MSDIILDKMRKMGVPETRENYLQFAYFGNPPEHLGAEEEAELPEQFRQYPEEGADDNTGADSEVEDKA